MDPRLLVATGITFYVVSMWQLGQMTTQSGMPDTYWPLIIRGMGLGMLFIPIAVAAYSGLKGQQIAQGSALFNLGRQLGGSLGIAVLNTYIADNTAAHRAALVTHLNAGNPQFESRLAGLQHLLMSHGDSAAHARSAALAALSHVVQTQASTMAYDDAFLLLGATFVLAFPAVFLLKRKKSSAAQAAGAH